MAARITIPHILELITVCETTDDEASQYLSENHLQFCGCVRNVTTCGNRDSSGPLLPADSQSIGKRPPVTAERTVTSNINAPAASSAVVSIQQTVEDLALITTLLIHLG